MFRVVFYSCSCKAIQPETHFTAGYSLRKFRLDGSGHLDDISATPVPADNDTRHGLLSAFSGPVLLRWECVQEL